MKFSLNPLEITTYIEEKRLILGKKIENFLIKKLNIFINYAKLFFNNEFSGLFCCFLIILVSLFKRSMVDIGQESGLYLENAQKIFEGKKYFYDFFEYNFPLNLLMLIIPVWISKILGFSPIISADYFVNLLAIFSLIWSYKILKNSQKIKSQFELNLIIICFTAGFFIRGKTLFFNEFLTKTTFLLIFFYPFFSYYLYGVEKLKKIQKIYLGILSALMILLKPNFIILLFLFEIYRIYQSRNIKHFLAIHNLVLITIVVNLFIFSTNFAQNLSHNLRIFYEYKINYQFEDFSNKYLLIFDKIQTDYLIYFMLIYVYLKNIQKNELVNYLTLLMSAIILIVFSGNFHIDEEVIFSALGLSFVIINFIIFLKQNQVSILRHWLLFFSLMIFCFISSETFNLMCSMLYYLALPILIYLLFFSSFVDLKNSLYPKIFLIFSIVILVFLKFYFLKLFDFFVVIFLLIISLINLNFLIQKYHQNKKSFYVINFIIFIATIGFIGNYFRAIFNNYSTQEAHVFFKSPNSQNQALFEILKSNIKVGENLIIFGDALQNSYPFRNYAKLPNESEFFKNDFLANNYRNEININKVLESFYGQITDPKNSVVVFYNYQDCLISNFEFLMRNSPEIQKYFFANFKFLTQHYSWMDDKSFTPNYTKEFLSNDEFDVVRGIDLTQPKIFKINVFEAYVRK
jgi:hypothetical protein